MDIPAETLIEVLLPMLVATVVSAGLHYWRGGSFSRAMVIVSGFCFLTQLVYLGYLCWFFSPSARLALTNFLSDMTTATFFGFWIALPLLGLAHFVWLARRKSPAMPRVDIDL